MNHSIARGSVFHMHSFSGKQCQNKKSLQVYLCAEIDLLWEFKWAVALSILEHCSIGRPGCSSPCSTRCVCLTNVTCVSTCRRELDCSGVLFWKFPSDSSIKE